MIFPVSQWPGTPGAARRTRDRTRRKAIIDDRADDFNVAELDGTQCRPRPADRGLGAPRQPDPRFSHGPDKTCSDHRPVGCSLPHRRESKYACLT
ncbi:hypothetical protein THSYN_22325 [Candidatus Thiodictyon syntrophicum]|uniref:Uncharacterized protein n=1 Tax=Candidatus Thiodictyon syntrophicum TaxID=1166950 RepID=A0A2K8UEA0_9GAMM|nr:hypothetical protein THSYN_22325 [Candidatus Thiodictyon syntrophicum]